MGIKHIYKDFRRGIKNLISYFFIIWRDRDFDHGYLETLMLFKLEKMYSRFTYVSSPVEWSSDISQKYLKALKICITILHRRKKGWYNNMMNFPEPTFTNLSDGLVSVDMGILDEHQRAINNGFRDLEERDWKIFCNIFSKYFEGWWD